MKSPLGITRADGGSAAGGSARGGSGGLPAGVPGDFASMIRSEAKERGITIGREQDSEPLARIPYETEIELKNAALNRFWRERDLPGSPEAFHPAPIPRGYRATSKRRVVSRGGKWYLVLDPGAAPAGFAELSSLEPGHHGAIFSWVARRINEPSCRVVGEGLNFVIVRESEGKGCLILNFHTLSATVVRGVKRMASELEKSGLPILSLFTFHDPSRSPYYLEADRPGKGQDMRKILGPPYLLLRVPGYRFFYGPTVFSQVNPCILPDFLSVLKAALPGPVTGRIIDLYCGYGLLGIALSGDAAQVYGIETNAEAIKNAIGNAERAGESADASDARPGRRCRFHFRTADITSAAMDKLLPEPDGSEVIILDPPRGGTERGVVTAAASRNPLLGIHIFCNADLLGRELSLWKRGGYRLSRAVPFDMFPGTTNCETVVFLERETGGSE